MNASSRTLTALACAGLLLAIGAWLFIRSGTSGSAPAPIAETDASSAQATLSKQLDATEPRRSAPAEEQPVADAAPTASCLRGLVLDDETDQPIDSFVILHSAVGEGHAYVDTILGFESSEAPPSETFAGTHGRFELADLDANPRSLCAFADGYARSDPVVATAPLTADLVIRLHRAAIVRGRVVDPGTGVPVQGALVGWIDHGGTTRTGPRERFERTDALGRFLLGSVPLSARRILAGREDIGEGLSQRLELAPGEGAQDIVIELPQSGS